jgi:hypothetical protein
VPTCLSFWGLEGDSERTTHEAIEEIIDDRCFVGLDCVDRFIAWLIEESKKVSRPSSRHTTARGLNTIS